MSVTEDGQSVIIEGDTTPPPPPAKPADPPAPPAGNGRTFTAEEVERIRKEEKDKLYPQMQSMRDELDQLKAQREQAEAERKQREKDEKAAAKKKSEEDMDVRQLLEERQREWAAQQQEQEARFAALSAEIERRDALLEQERRFNFLMEYRRAAIEANADAIIPELRDLVTGNSEEEIDASVASLVERSNRILEQVSTARAGATRMPAPSGATAVGPLDTTPGTQTLSAEDIRNMSMEDYMKNRQKLIGSAGQGSGRGLYS